MLTISDDLAAVLSADSVEKQLVISFPFESRDDITNDHLVDESMEFQESICSADALKFGLAEASRLEFECFDEADMTGSTIDAKIGVDGEYVPLGRFIVDECQRDYTGARLMKVTAYTNRGADLDYAPVELAKRSTHLRLNAEYRFFPEKLFYSSLPGLTADGLTLTEITSGFNTPGTQDWNVRYTDSGNYVRVYVQSRRYTLDATKARYLYYYDTPEEFSDASISAAITACASSLGLTFTDEEISLCIQRLRERMFKIGLNIPTYTTSSSTYYEILHTQPLNYHFIDPYMFYNSTERTVVYNHDFSIVLPYRFYITKAVSGSTTTEYSSSFFGHFYNTSTDYSSGYLTIQRVKTKNAWGNTAYMIGENPPFIDFLANYSETLGKFVKFERDGSAELITLDNTSLITYDKDDIREKSLLTKATTGKIGKAVLSWNDGAEDNFTEVTVNADGAYTYDLTSNSLLAGLTTEAAVTTALNAFAAAVQDVEYVPLKVQLRGLPQVEAGDRVTIDGNETYVLSRRISGINSLRDEVTAQ